MLGVKLELELASFKLPLTAKSGSPLHVATDRQCCEIVDTNAWFLQTFFFNESDDYGCNSLHGNLDPSSPFLIFLKPTPLILLCRSSNLLAYDRAPPRFALLARLHAVSKSQVSKRCTPVVYAVRCQSKLTARCKPTACKLHEARNVRCSLEGERCYNTCAGVSPRC